MKEWQLLLQKLQRFKQVFGHYQVPYPWPEDPLLSEWVAGLPVAQDQLAQPVQEALQEAGFDFSVSTAAGWQDYYQQLEVFQKQHGHVYVPAKDSLSRTLFSWMQQQRQAKGVLSEAQIAQLDQLRFDWQRHNPKKQQWEEMFHQLVTFREQYGHCRVPSSFKENKSLAKWVTRQREQEDTMLPERKEKLLAVGFSWKRDLEAMDEAAWEEKYNLLCQFVRQQGHFQIPSTKMEYHSLRIWVDHQRKRKDVLSEERLQKLQAIGFPWGEDIVMEQEEAWLKMLQKLASFKERFGHVRVPSKWKEDPALGGWVTRQRLKKDTLSAQQQAKLKAIGFVWSKDIVKSKEQKWLALYRELKAFHEQHGHARVPDQYSANPTLGKWVSWQRKSAQEGKLSKNRKKMLDELGFRWSEQIQRENRLRWERMYLRLKRFYKKYGHTRVPEGWSHDKSLAIWVGMLRQHEHRVTLEQRQKLNDLHFAWPYNLQQEREQIWLDSYEKLVAFHQQHGHCQVTVNHSDQKLFRWVAKQRRDQHKLKAHRLKKLNAIGFIWKEDNQQARQQKWDAMYEQLVEFKQRFGHCRVPDRWPENTKLSYWVSHQRQKWHSLPEERKTRLAAIGFHTNS